MFLIRPQKQYLIPRRFDLDSLALVSLFATWEFVIVRPIHLDHCFLLFQHKIQHHAPPSDMVLIWNEQAVEYLHHVALRFRCKRSSYQWPQVNLSFQFHSSALMPTSLAVRDSWRR